MTSDKVMHSAFVESTPSTIQMAKISRTIARTPGVIWQFVRCMNDNFINILKDDLICQFTMTPAAFITLKKSISLNVGLNKCKNQACHQKSPHEQVPSLNKWNRAASLTRISRWVTFDIYLVALWQSPQTLKFLTTRIG